MTKYDFDLDLASTNSLSLIAKKIMPNSKVLEFGPAAGRLTKYMREALNCSIYIVEIDEDAAEKASQYAEKSIVGDIEKFTWLEEFKEINFDYILFADVLEHLYNPKKVLQATKELLSENGSVVISIPNITHSSVIADLLVNKFDYRDTGLLDDTHIRFFTYDSLCKMIDECGYYAVSKEATYKSIYESELGNQFDILPKNTQNFLKNKAYSDVYQFIFEIKDSKSEDKFTEKIKFVSPYSYYFAQLYINNGQGFSESQCLKKDIYLSQNNLKINFELIGFDNIKCLRFDPINANSTIKLNEIIYTDYDGNTYIVPEYNSNAAFQKDDFLCFLVDDPQITFNVEVKSIKTITFKFNIIDAEFEVLGVINELIHENSNIKKSNENFNHQAEIMLKSINTIEKERNNFIEQTNNLLSTQSENLIKIKKLEELVGQKQNEIANLQADLQLFQLKLNSINKSIISKIKNVFKSKEKR